eukprot:NODE_7259_length_578_cov_6.826087_g6251_i0.p3 GENE.NODE_7259_length_578_cov_6.826087_g6251_i0~~NODE_7259_length_578_cov_6.826087_g6251_i0.p3  ORF type:complete len:53 (+),score=3.36 NODE_7259_length_578_cov_6.826087_g6251_i0:93-251(+)
MAHVSSKARYARLRQGTAARPPSPAPLARSLTEAPGAAPAAPGVTGLRRTLL